MKEQPKIILCPHCGEKENFHFNYDYTQKHMPIIDVLCNECGEFFNSKEQQKKLITEIMEEDAKDLLYDIDYKNSNLGIKDFSPSKTIDINPIKWMLIIKTQGGFLWRLWFLISAPFIWLFKGEIKIK
jgi:hypothetical protein